MKRTLFLSALLAACFSHAYGETTHNNSTTTGNTYTVLDGAFRNEDNKVVYDGLGTFYVNSSPTTEIDVTISLSALDSYLKTNDYTSSGFVTWTYNVTGGLTSWGLNDTNTGITGSWNGGAYGSVTSYETLKQYANGDTLTLTIINDPKKSSTVTDGIYVYATSNGVRTEVWGAGGLFNSNATATTSYKVNTNYVTSITIKTASTLDTSTFAPPVDYSQPFVSSRTDGTTVGRIMFIGDSITHGVSDATWRWQLFKTLTDNGIENEIVGPLRGFDSRYAFKASGTVISEGLTQNSTSATYGQAEFSNVHLAQSSGRAHELINDNNSRYAGVSTEEAAQQYNSNTYVMLIGTNDLLSDSGYTEANFADKMDNLLGGTVTYNDETKAYSWNGTIGGNMYTAVSDVLNESTDKLYLMTVPCWTDHGNNNGETSHHAVDEYNRLLAQWVDSYNKTYGDQVVLVDVNKGLVDVTSSDPSFKGHRGFFNNPGSDGLHPNEQGSLIMAGNLAQAMGIGGRTAGLQRMGTTSWSGATVGTNGTVAAGEAYLYGENAFTMEGGYTVDFSAGFGDGAANGWSSANEALLSISLGDGTNSGTLNLSEGYIMWGSDVLFCWDNSTLAEEGNIRIAWHNGNATDNVLSGYYVWLGDMLIGQGLNATEGEGLNGIIISASGANGTVNNLTWTDTAYAPTTEGMVSPENAYLTQQDAAAVSGQVNNTSMLPMPSTLRINTPTTSGVDYSNTEGQHLTGNILVKSSSTVARTFKLTGSNGWVAITDQKNAHDINVQVTGSTGSTIFGMKGGATAGTLTLEVTDGAYINGTGHYTYNNVQYKAAIAGAFDGGTSDNFNVLIHGGLVDGDIVGGTINSGCDIKSVNLTINNGTVNGSVIGGSKTANGKVGTAAIVINGGTITGNINAGGDAGSIGDTSVTIKGGVINGNIVKGSATRTAGAQTTVTVEGNKAKIGTNNNGSITADTVTFRDVTASSYSDGFDKYSGSVTAEKLTLDNVNVDVLATLDVKAIEVVNGSTTSVILGDTATLATLTLDSDTVFGAFKAAEARTADTASETTISVGTLTAGTGATLNANLKFSADSTLNLAGSLAMGSSVELATGMTLGLSPEMLEKLYSGVSLELFTGVDSLKLDGETITAGTTLPADDIFSGLSADYTYEMGFNGGVISLSATMVPEPTTATLSLLALAALAARRRRR